MNELACRGGEPTDSGGEPAVVMGRLTQCIGKLSMRSDTETDATREEEEQDALGTSIDFRCMEEEVTMVGVGDQLGINTNGVMSLEVREALALEGTMYYKKIYALKA